MGSWLSFPDGPIEVRILDTDAGEASVVSNTVECVVDLLRRHSPHCTVITGAGISAHQLPTFRSNDNSGLWEAFTPANGAVTRAGFYSKPKQTWLLLANIRHLQITGRLHPSLAHHVVHHLLRQHFVSHVITQNIDSLHSFRGDLDSVTELHGAVHDYGICEQCRRHTQIDVVEIIHNQTCPICETCGAVLKPPVAFFGDLIETEKRDRAAEVLCDSSLVITIGTHMAVDPVLSMVTTAKQNNSVIVQINLTATAANRFVDVALQGKADDILGAIGRQLMPQIDWDGLKLDEWDSAC
jgi:NAD-dependent deacetylase